MLTPSELVCAKPMSTQELFSRSKRFDPVVLFIFSNLFLCVHHRKPYVDDAMIHTHHREGFVPALKTGFMY